MSTLNAIGMPVSVRLAPQVFRAMNRELLSINDSFDIRFQERPVSKEALVNAVLVDFLSLPLEERRAIIESSLKSLENLLIEPNSKADRLDIGRLQEPGVNETKRKASAKPVRKKSARLDKPGGSV